MMHPALNSIAAMGYSDLSIICETESFFVYRALAKKNQPVFVKTPALPKPPASILEQLEHEFKIARDLDPELVIRPLRIEQYAGQTAMILKACAYPPLSQSLGTPFEIETFISMAIGVAAALGQIHRQGLVHKNLEPASIFATSAGKARLTGFGVASRLTGERREPVPQEDVTGPLAYMAPEQTGRMNRSIDGRSDLYALGVIFYHMLTGRLPFTATDPMEWIHCHIALQPVPPHQRISAIPRPLSDIIMKLMAKTAEDRYQTAQGLTADLEHCFNEWRTHGGVMSFIPGAHDVPHRLMIPEKLYGREREMATLLTALQRTSTGARPALVLISGYAGVGKSVLVNELSKALVSLRSLFASGKYDQDKSAIPYSTVAQAFGMLIRPLLLKSEAELESWRRTLGKALDPNGRLIADLVPELKLIIGEPPPIPELGPQQAKVRFQLVFRRFISVFARPECPLTLFFDDLQWLDAATLDLIEDLASQQEVRHLLLIGAYRNNEVGPDHPLTRRIKAIRQAGAVVSEIELAPLTRDDLTQMVADALHCEFEKASALAQLVYDKTAGNPFFIIEFLTALNQEGQLAFDHGRGRWSWDLKRIQNKGYTDNVADLVAAKIRRLPAKSQSALQWLASLGYMSQTSVISMVSEIPEKGLHEALQASLSQGFVQRVGNGYRFSHDRIQETAYSLTPEKKRPAVHLLIGKRLLERTAPEKLHEKLFDVVNHLNRGADLINLTEKRIELARLNLNAGLKAKATAAFSAAADYFNKGLSLLGSNRWQTHYDITLSLFAEAIEAEYVMTHYERAQSMAEQALANARDPLDRARLVQLKIMIFTQIPDYQSALDTGLSELQRLGIPLVETPPEQVDLHQINDLPPMTDPVRLMAMKLMITLIGSAYILSPQTLQTLTYSMVALSRKYGNSAPSTYAYGLFGALLVAAGEMDRAHQFGKSALILCERLNAPEMKSMALNMFNSCIRHWKEPLQGALSDMADGVEFGLQYGDIENVAYCANHYCNNLLFSATPLDAVESTVHYHLALVRKLRQWYAVSFLNITQQTVQNLKLPSSAPGSLEGEYVREQELLPDLIENNNFTLLFWFYTAKTILNYLFGRAGQAARCADRAKPHEGSSLGLIAVGQLAFYRCLALLGRYQGANATADRAGITGLDPDKKRLMGWSAHAPENFRHKYDLVLAEEARVFGRTIEAMERYEKAIRGARDNGFIQETALAYERAAIFYLGRQMQETARLYLVQAYEHYARWGAGGKVRHLERLYPWLAQGRRSLTTTLAQQLDAVSVAKAQQAISGEIQPDSLARTLLRIVMESAGAQTGCLSTEGSDLLRAEMQLDGNGGQRMVFDTSPQAPNIPETIINYVRRSRKTLILADARTDAGELSADDYLRRVKPRSVLCMAIQRQERLLAVIYLENNLITGAFTPERCLLLEVLASQAAISLENALMYGALRESEKGLRQLTRFHQTILNSAAYCIVSATPDGIITSFNQAAERLLGYTVNEVIGKQTPALWHDPQEIAQHASRLSVELDEKIEPGFDVFTARPKRNQPEENEWTFIRKDGGRVPVNLSVTALRNENHQITGYVGMIYDLTERKQAEEEIHRLNTELEQRVADRTAELQSTNKELEAFAYSISHDLRAPLRHIDAFLELLKEQATAELNQKSRYYMEAVSNAAQKMGLLIDDLLAFSRMGRQAMNLRQVDLQVLVRDIIAELAPDTADRSIHWRIGDLPVVSGDAAMLKIVLTNLAANAVKFTRPREKARIEIGSQPDPGSGTVVFVRDNGVGFDMAHADNLFGVFQRLHRDDEFEGTGIGLANVRRIVERRGGRVWVKAEPDRGAVFYFSIPHSTLKGEPKP
jgi:PAS domain S-box-containing protein